MVGKKAKMCIGVIKLLNNRWISLSLKKYPSNPSCFCWCFGWIIMQGRLSSTVIEKYLKRGISTFLLLIESVLALQATPKWNEWVNVPSPKDISLLMVPASQVSWKKGRKQVVYCFITLRAVRLFALIKPHIQVCLHPGISIYTSIKITRSQDPLYVWSTGSPKKSLKQFIQSWLRQIKSVLWKNWTVLRRGLLIHYSSKQYMPLWPDENVNHMFDNIRTDPFLVIPHAVITRICKAIFRGQTRNKRPQTWYFLFQACWSSGF